MAIVRLPRKDKKFTYEGVDFTMRKAVTSEVAEVTKRIAAYQRSVKVDLVKDVADNIAEYGTTTGDTTLMAEAQKYVAQTFVIDPESRRSIFGTDADQNNIEEAPKDFIDAAWFCYTDQDIKPILAVEVAKALGEEDSFVKQNAYVSPGDLEAHLAKLPPDRRAEVRRALNLAREVPQSEEDPQKATPVATTSDSGGVSS